MDREAPAGGEGSQPAGPLPLPDGGDGRRFWFVGGGVELRFEREEEAVATGFCNVGGIGGPPSYIASFDGVWVFDRSPRPRCFLALRTARWCWLRAACSCSFVSIMLSMVSLSGEGLVDVMYPCILREALRQRSANSLIRSLERISAGGVQATTCSSSLADVRASSNRFASSTGSGSRLLLWLREK